MPAEKAKAAAKKATPKPAAHPNKAAAAKAKASPELEVVAASAQAVKNEPPFSGSAARSSGRPAGAFSRQAQQPWQAFRRTKSAQVQLRGLEPQYHCAE